MKVRVAFTVDIDVNAWRNRAGLFPDPNARDFGVRKHVQDTIEQGVRESLHNAGLLTPGIER